MQQGPCLPTAPTTARRPPNRCRKTGRAFRAPRQPFRAPRHSQPHTHAEHTLLSMWERGEAFGGPWGLGDRRSHGPWAVAEPAHQTPRKSGQKNVRGWVGLIYPLGTYPGQCHQTRENPLRYTCPDQTASLTGLGRDENETIWTKRNFPTIISWSRARPKGL